MGIAKASLTKLKGMDNMKKFFLIAIAALVLVLSLTALVACEEGECVHSADESVTENYVSAKCAVPGGYDSVVYCKLCGDELSRVHTDIEALGHDLVHHEEKAPTCTSDGWEKYDTCSRCDYSTYKALPASHTSAETARIENEVAPSCGKVGGCDYVWYCTECGEELYRDHVTLEALEHEILHCSAHDATCCELGWYDYDYCARCDYSTRVDIPLAEHDYGNAPVEENVVKAKCDQAGSYDSVVYCGVCGKELERSHFTVQPTNHTPSAATTENVTEGDCHTAGGWDEVVRCADCGSVLNSTHFTTQKKHSPSAAVKENVVEPVYVYGGRCTDGGWDEVVYCGICGEELSREHKIKKITAKEYYSRFDFLELSASVNTIDNLVDNQDGTYTLSAKTNGGKNVRLLIVGEIAELEGGWGAFGEDTRVYILDALPGVNFIDCEFTTPVNELLVKGYFNLQGKTSVSAVSELFSGNTSALIGRTSKAEFEQYPDYICFNAPLASQKGTAAEAISIKIYYCNVMSTIAEIKLNTDLYTKSYSKNSYVVGDRYDGAIEQTGVEFGFPLLLRFDNSACLSGASKFYCDITIIDDNVKFGSIKDADGNVVDKTDRFLQKGDKIEVTIGNCTAWLELCTPTFTGDSLYETSDVCYIKSVGTQNVLVIPVTFADQKDRVNDTWLAALRGVLGNVMDANGKVTKYTVENCDISLSEFLYTSSYGKLTVNSFITAPYVINGNAADYYDIIMPSSEFEAINKWLGEQGIDNSAFDQNGDGYYDVVILVNTLLYGDGTKYDGDYYERMGMSGGFKNSISTDTRAAGTKEKPNINTYLNIAAHFIFKADGIKTHTIIHEFGHVLGLTDYYANDNYFSSTIGKFDMESDNKGDWNSYSKYLLGWIEPEVVDASKVASAEGGLEITLKAYSTHGSAVLIRAIGYDGNGTPYDEYILIDLFAHDGLYAKDAESYKLEDSVGIRIYHVNSVYDMTSITWEGKETVSARPHHGVDSYSRYAADGIYLIELVQNGNVSDFMNGNASTTTIGAADLFYEGDSFSADTYDAFFRDGKMDNGMDFGYTITVKEIVENGADSTATIVISKKAS